MRIVTLLLSITLLSISGCKEQSQNDSGSVSDSKPEPNGREFTPGNNGSEEPANDANKQNDNDLAPGKDMRNEPKKRTKTPHEEKPRVRVVAPAWLLDTVTKRWVYHRYRGSHVYIVTRRSSAGFVDDLNSRAFHEYTQSPSNEIVVSSLGTFKKSVSGCIQFGKKVATEPVSVFCGEVQVFSGIVFRNFDSHIHNGSPMDYQNFQSGAFRGPGERRYDLFRASGDENALRIEDQLESVDFPKSDPETQIAFAKIVLAILGKFDPEDTESIVGVNVGRLVIGKIQSGGSSLNWLPNTRVECASGSFYMRVAFGTEIASHNPQPVLQVLRDQVHIGINDLIRARIQLSSGDDTKFTQVAKQLLRSDETFLDESIPNYASTLYQMEQHLDLEFLHSSGGPVGDNRHHIGRIVNCVTSPSSVVPKVRICFNLRVVYVNSSNINYEYINDRLGSLSDDDTVGPNPTSKFHRSLPLECTSGLTTLERIPACVDHVIKLFIKFGDAIIGLYMDSLEYGYADTATQSTFLDNQSIILSGWYYHIREFFGNVDQSGIKRSVGDWIVAHSRIPEALFPANDEELTTNIDDIIPPINVGAYPQDSFDLIYGEQQAEFSGCWNVYFAFDVVKLPQICLKVRLFYLTDMANQNDSLLRNFNTYTNAERFTDIVSVSPGTTREALATDSAGDVSRNIRTAIENELAYCQLQLHGCVTRLLSFFSYKSQGFRFSPLNPAFVAAEIAQIKYGLIERNAAGRDENRATECAQRKLHVCVYRSEDLLIGRSKLVSPFYVHLVPRSNYRGLFEPLSRDIHALSHRKLFESKIAEWVGSANAPASTIVVVPSRGTVVRSSFRQGEIYFSRLVSNSDSVSVTVKSGDHGKLEGCIHTQSGVGLCMTGQIFYQPRTSHRPDDSNSDLRDVMSRSEDGESIRNIRSTIPVDSSFINAKGYEYSGPMKSDIITACSGNNIPDCLVAVLKVHKSFNTDRRIVGVNMARIEYGPLGVGVIGLPAINHSQVGPNIPKLRICIKTYHRQERLC